MKLLLILVATSLLSSVLAQDSATKGESKPASTEAGTNALPATTGAAPAAEAAPANDGEAAGRFEDLPTLFELTKKDAVKGDAKAQADLGVKYLFGHGIAPDA